MRGLRAVVLVIAGGTFLAAAGCSWIASFEEKDAPASDAGADASDDDDDDDETDAQGPPPDAGKDARVSDAKTDAKPGKDAKAN